MAEEQDEQTERLLQRLVEANDPMRGRQVAAPRRSAAELRRLADQRRADRRWRSVPRPGVRPRLLVPVVAVAVAVGALVLVNALPGGLAGLLTPGPVGLAAAPAVLGVQFPGEAGPAGPRLRELAQRIATLDEAPGSGRYTYLHLQSWSLDTTSADPEVANAVVARDERLWWAADRSGRERVVVLPPQPADAERAAWLDELPADAPERWRTDYRPGELAVVVDDPAADPALLAGQLSAHEPFDNGPQAVIRAVASLYRYHEMSPAVRAAALRVLGDTKGLVYRGSVVDRAGRTGVAVSVDSAVGATRDMAVLDPDTGALLSYEQVALISPPRSAVRAPAVISYVLYLAHQRTDQLG